jgi:electron transport complex protein RnfC
MSFLAGLFWDKSSTKAHKTPGGIKPADFKDHSLRSQIMTPPVPKELWLSLRQKDGNNLETLVAVGDKVLKHQLIAAATTPFGVPIHAPTSGQIKEIAAKLVVNAFEERQLHIVIAADGLDNSQQLHPLEMYQSISKIQLIAKLHDLGVGELGGADSPKVIKPDIANQSQTELLIINACECEPFISADEALIREKAEQVVIGVEILQRASGANNSVIAIETRMLDSIQALKAALENRNIKLVLVQTKYPAGDKNQIIQAVTGKEVPSGDLQKDNSILVHNVGTAYAAYNAVIKGQAYISRITTLAGKPLKTAKNFEALIGTPVPFLLELCGNDTLKQESTIVGGSLMGITLFEENVPITRKTNCIIAACSDWFPEPPAELACIRCGDCADVCPAKLLPQQLYAFSRSQDLENLEDQNLIDCIECGACSYVCPSNIPLVQYFRASKATQQDHLKQSELSGHWKERYQFHQSRLIKDKEESKTRKARVTKSRAANSESMDFSRSTAKTDIAAAVNRVKKRKIEAALKKAKEAKNERGEGPI